MQALRCLKVELFQLQFRKLVLWPWQVQFFDTFVFSIKPWLLRYLKNMLQINVPPPPWIFIHGTDIVDRGLIVLFFGLFLLFFGRFSVASYPGNFSADAC